MTLETANDDIRLLGKFAYPLYALVGAFTGSRKFSSAKNEFKQDGAELYWVIVTARYRKGPRPPLRFFWGGLKKGCAKTFEALVKISVLP